MSSDVSRDVERLQFLQERAAALYSIAYRIREALGKPIETGFDFKLVPPFADLQLQVKQLMDELQTLKDEIAEEINRLEKPS